MSNDSPTYTTRVGRRQPRQSSSSSMTMGPFDLARLTPSQDEVYLNFAWRLRSAYLPLQASQQEAGYVREMITDALRHHMPRVWIQVKRDIDGVKNSQIFERVVRSNANPLRTAFTGPRMLTRPFRAQMLRSTTSRSYTTSTTTTCSSRCGTCRTE